MLLLRRSTFTSIPMKTSANPRATLKLEAFNETNKTADILEIQWEIIVYDYTQNLIAFIMDVERINTKESMQNEHAYLY